MAVFRVEKNRNYTVMANQHLLNEKLSLRAKGLQSMMLTFSDKWDYTAFGLTKFCTDGIDSINAGLRELEKEGYLQRKRIRNEKGQLLGTEYIIWEIPPSVQAAAQEAAQQAEPKQENPLQVSEKQAQLEGETPQTNLPEQAQPILEKPILENPILGCPIQATPILEKPVQINTNIINTNRLSNNQSNPNLSTQGAQNMDGWDSDRCSTPEPVCMGCRDIGCDSIEEVEELVKFSIEYDHFAKKPIVAERVAEIVDLLVEVFASSQPTMTIGKEEYPSMFVKNRLRKLNGMHIEYVLDCLDHNANPIRNIKRYLLTALFNAPSTVDNYYATMVSQL